MNKVTPLRYVAISIILVLFNSALILSQNSKPLSKVDTNKSQDSTSAGSKELKSTKPSTPNEGIKNLKAVILKKPTSEDFEISIKPLDAPSSSSKKTNELAVGVKPLDAPSNSSKKAYQSETTIIIPSHNNDKPILNVTHPKPSIYSKDIPLSITDTGSDYPEMVNINGGIFKMGSSFGQADELPVHLVEVSTFEMSKYEITNYQFQVFVKATGYKTLAEREKSLSWQNYAKAGREKYPVVMVSWEDANEYCIWLSNVTGENYKLPTEAQWEYAACAGENNNSDNSSKENLDLTEANFSKYINQPSDLDTELKCLRQVGSYQPNSYQLYDMLGNVSEWCQDFYDTNYYENSEEKDPTGPDSGIFIYQVNRGGSWSDPAFFCRTSFRNAATIDYKSSSVGFRVVRQLQVTYP